MSTKAVAGNVEHLRGGLVVSAQAHGDHPLRDSEVIARLAECGVRGGAVGLRLDGADDIRAVRGRGISVPVIGLWKVPFKHRFAITTTFEHAAALAESGASVIAVECTAETDFAGLEVIRRVKAELDLPVMADTSTREEALRAWQAGADLVGTTLSGYLEDQLPTPSEPDLALVHTLVAEGLQVVAEGRYATPEQVKDALDAGAHCVVVGSALTDPLVSTRRFVDAIACG